MLTLRMLAHLLPGVYKDLYPLLRRKLRLCDCMMAARAQMPQQARESPYTIHEAIAAAQAGYAHMLILMPMGEAVAHAAAAYDHIDCVKYCLSMGTYPKLFNVAVRNGSVGIVTTMLQNGWKVDWCDLENALLNDRLNIATIIHACAFISNNHMANIAARVCGYGNIAAYEFLCAHGHSTTQWDLQYAGKSSLEMFKHVYARVVANGVVIEHQMEFPLVHGRIEILDYVHTHIRKYGTMHVNCCGTVESLEWCRRMNIWEITHDQHNVPAEYGNADASKWLIANGVPLPNSREMWIHILSCGELTPYFTWMIENNQPPADISHMAADHCNIEVLEYLRTHDYPLQEQCYSAACRFNHHGGIRLFEYLVKHVPCDSIYTYAIFSGQPELLRWTLANIPCDILMCMEEIKVRMTEGVHHDDIWLEMIAILAQHRRHTQPI
jgi:hypothetical protein